MSEKLDEAELAIRLTDVEVELNSQYHQGVPLGYLLSTYIQHIYLRFVSKKDDPSSLLCFLLTFKYILLSVRKPKILKRGHLNNYKYLIAKWDNTVERNNKLFRDLPARLGSYLLYTNNKKEVDPKVNYLLKGEFVYLNPFFIFSFLFQCISSTIYSYRKINKKVGERTPFLNLLFYTVHVSLQLNAWKRYFVLYKPQIIITDMDRFYPELILAARKNNITTITLVHGVINSSYGYYPLLTDFVFCWGKDQKEYFLSKGIFDNKIRVVGNPIAQKFQKINRVSLMSKLNIDNKSYSFYIGIAATILSLEDNIAFLKAILLFNDESTLYIIKMHPSDNNFEKIKSYFKHLKNVYFCQNDFVFQEFISLINVCILSTSGIGYELVVNNIPVLFLNIDNCMKNTSYNIYMNRYIYNNVSNLVAFITELRFNDQNYNQILKEQLNIVDEYIYKAISENAIGEIEREIYVILNAA